MRENHEYKAGDIATVMLDGKPYKSGIIREFQGTMVVIDTPTSEIHCQITCLE